jgi:hypothetical protein
MSLLSISLLGIVISTLLTAYALFLWLKIWRQQRKVANTLHTQTLNQQRATESARQNITIMLRVVVQEQVSLTEAAIRIMAYCRALPAEERDSSLYQPFDQLARATAHIPILDRWQALPPKEQIKLDHERQKLEEDHREDIINASHAALKSLRAAKTQNNAA